jgi:hypothetical protein
MLSFFIEHKNVFNVFNSGMVQRVSKFQFFWAKDLREARQKNSRCERNRWQWKTEGRKFSYNRSMKILRMLHKFPMLHAKHSRKLSHDDDIIWLFVFAQQKAESKSLMSCFQGLLAGKIGLVRERQENLLEIALLKGIKFFPPK